MWVSIIGALLPISVKLIEFFVSKYVFDNKTKEDWKNFLDGMVASGHLKASARMNKEYKDVGADLDARMKAYDEKNKKDNNSL